LSIDDPRAAVSPFSDLDGVPPLRRSARRPIHEAMHEPQRYDVFDTARGFVAIAWSARGVTSLRLPSHSPAAAEDALFKRVGRAVRATPPPPIASVIAAAKRYFAGETVDFSDVAVDLGEADPFFARVYARIRELRWGETTTYGAIAKDLGAGPEAARDVGQAMAANPVPLIVPCHRVLAAGGKLGGFSAPGGADTKLRMLEIEGAAPRTETPAAPSQATFGFLLTQPAADERRAQRRR
jgi:methylated-DNA-[protein]-cysteine S-methyltransferase